MKRRGGKQVKKESRNFDRICEKLSEDSASRKHWKR
jgi:hypothetical protein